MKFVSVIHKIAQKIEVISWIALMAMMITVAFNCVGRQFDLPIHGTYDLACFLLVLITAPALCRCAVDDGHIRLDMLTNKFPKRVQHIVDIIIDICSVAFCGILAYALFKRCMNHIENGMMGQSLPIPVWPFILIEFIVTALLALVYIADIIVLVEKLRGKEAESK